MNKICFAVCDDDEITCDVVCRRIFAIFKKCGIEASGAKYFSSATLYNHIAYSREGEAYKYDLVFLDIDMPKYSGMDVAEEIRKKSADTDIIFVSNREDRVFETFSVQPFGFIRKNCFTEDLNATLRQYIQKKLAQESFLVVHTNNNSSTLKLAVSDIVYVESMRDHQYIKLGSGEKVDVRMTLGEIEEKLASFDIVRVHKSFLVNYKYVQRLETSELLLTGGEKVPVSRNKARDVKDGYLKYLRKAGYMM